MEEDFVKASKENDPTRRTLVKGVMALPLAHLAASARTAPRAPHLISLENAKPGTLDWQLTNVLLDKSGGFRSPIIEGYCSHQSIEAGQTLQNHGQRQPSGPS